MVRNTIGMSCVKNILSQFPRAVAPVLHCGVPPHVCGARHNAAIEFIVLLYRLTFKELATAKELMRKEDG